MVSFLRMALNFSRKELHIVITKTPCVFCLLFISLFPRHIHLKGFFFFFGVLLGDRRIGVFIIIIFWGGGGGGVAEFAANTRTDTVRHL